MIYRDRRALFGAAFDRTPSSKVNWWWVAAITLGALALRVYRIDVQSFWADEVESVRVLFDLREAVAHVLFRNFHGPLHKALLFIWAQLFGSSDLALRLLSATIGTLTVPLIYAAGRRWVGERAALFSALLLAVNPFHVWYSQEVRGYVLLMALGVLMIWAFLSEIRERSAKSALAVFATSLAGCLSSFGGLFLIGAHSLLALVAGWRRGYPIGRFVVIQLLVLICLAPYLMSFGETVDPDTIVGLSDVAPEDRLRGTHTFSPLALAHTFYAYSVGTTLGPSINEMHRSLTFSTFQPYLVSIICAFIAFGMLAVAGALGARRRPERLGWIMAWLIVPIVCTAVLAMLNVKVYNVRYPSIGLCAWVLLLGIGVDRVGPRFIRALLLIMVLGLSFLSLYNHYFDTRYWKPDARAAAELVLRDGRPGDRILLYTTREPFAHYYQKVGNGPLEIVKVTGWDLDPVRIDARLDEIGSCDGRLWLIRHRSWYVDPSERGKRKLDSRFELLESWHFPELPVDLYRCSAMSDE